MTSPYTLQPLDALMAAQTSVGLLLGALVWLRRLRPLLATVLLLLAIALSVAAPVSATFFSSLGIAVGPEHTKHVLKLAALSAASAALLTRRPLLVIVSSVGAVALWVITNFIQESDWELAGAHLAFFGLLVGLHARTVAARRDLEGSIAPEIERPVWLEDVAVFGIATLAGAVVCGVVMHGWTNSGDEWGNTFQAALFAKLHAYGTVPRCGAAFRSFWVFQYMGRSFAQYTPGWPYFMTPFVALRVPWLAGPASFGLLAAGVARLGRRAAAGFCPGTSPASPSHVRAAGRFAALAIVLGSTMLINGGSRYPHVFVAAMYAWSVEALLAVADENVPHRPQWVWGMVLGATASLLLAARPGDGATLGIGLFAYFAYALARRRIGWRSVVGGALVFFVVGGVTLVVLRLQLGQWLKTGYSLNSLIYPWNKVAWSLPKPSEYKWSLPLATGAYCWWPCSPAGGLAGLAALRGKARHMGFIFSLSYVPFLVFYALLEIGRGFDFGYGPRYELPWVVPMAVGTGLVLAHLWTAARAPATACPALAVGGPAAIAMLAVGLGVVRVAPMLLAATYADVQSHNRLHEALAARRDIHHAVVFAGGGLNNTDPMDLTENLPLELYPEQDVLIALGTSPDQVRCVRDEYRTRNFYRALPENPVRIVPF